MLEAIRQGTKSWLFKGLLMILVLSFAVWGIGDIFRGGGGDAVAIVGDAEITPQQLDKAYQQSYRRLSNQLGGELNPQQAQDLALLQSTLDELINQVVIGGALASMGLAAADEMVGRDVRTNPAFHNDDGEFDRAVFDQVLASNGYSETSYLASLRTDIARSQLLNSLKSGIRVPRALAIPLYMFRQEQRIAEYAIMNKNSVPNIAKPDIHALRDYYREHETQFTAPEYRKLTYLILSAEDLVTEVSVSDEELAEEYEYRLDEFTTPERRIVEQLLYESEDDANLAYNLIKSGTNFHNAGEETNSLTKSNTSLGKILRNELPNDIANQVFSLPVGTISEPLQGPFGWYLFKVTHSDPGFTRNLDDVKHQLKHDIALLRAGDTLFEMANQIEDEFAGGADLGTAAGRLNLKLQRVTAIDANGKDPSGKQVAVPEFDEFLEIAFSTPTNSEAALSESSDGMYFIVQVDSITPSTLRPYAEINAQVHDAWLNWKREEFVKKEAEGIVIKLNSGEDFRSLARAHGMMIQTTQALGRADFVVNPDIPPRLLLQLFNIDEGQATSGPLLDHSGYVIAQVADIQDATPSNKTSEVEELRKQLRKSISTDLIAQYLSELKQAGGVRINREILQSFF